MSSIIRSSANIFRILARPQCTRKTVVGTPSPLAGYLGLHNQLRCAGHAKWQNIKGTKEATDMARGKMISRYVMLVRRAVVYNNMQTDPKLNGSLAAVLSEAGRMNVPKATLERAIIRATNLKIIQLFLEVQGAEGYTLILRCETENVGHLRRDVKKAIKKLDANMLPDNTLLSMFKSQGFIRASTTTKDGRSINEEFAEEAAIIANAEDVRLEEEVKLQGDGDAADLSEPEKVWVFSVETSQVDACKGELEKLGLNIQSSDIEMVPYREIKFPPEVVAKADLLIKTLRELEQVIDVYHNVDMSGPSEPAAS